MTLQDCVWRGKFEICEAIEPVPDGKVLLNYIRQVSFTSKSTSLGCTGTVPHLKEQWHEIVDPFLGPKNYTKALYEQVKTVLQNFKCLRDIAKTCVSVVIDCADTVSAYSSYKFFSFKKRDKSRSFI